MSGSSVFSGMASEQYKDIIIISVDLLDRSQVVPLSYMCPHTQVYWPLSWEGPPCFIYLGGGVPCFISGFGDEGSHVSLGMGLFAHQYVGTVVSTADVLSVWKTARPNSKTYPHFHFHWQNQNNLCCDGMRTLDKIVTWIRHFLWECWWLAITWSLRLLVTEVCSRWWTLGIWDLEFLPLLS